MADHITKIGAERMLRGAELLDSIPKRLFDMDSIYEAQAHHIGDRRNPKMHDSPKVKCRSRACVLGWMGSDPWFRNRGLKLMVDIEEIESAKRWGATVFGDIYYKGLDGFDAAAEFFGIDYEDVERLFEVSSMNESGSTPKQVAAAMRRFVKTGKVAR